MDNVGIVVESLDAAISFFAELGLELEGRAMVEGDWSGRVTGLRDQRVEIAMMRMPDGHGRIELSRFLTPPVVADHRNAPVNALGYLRVMFAVDDLDDTLARLREHGAQLVDEVVQYKDVYRLCYLRGPEGILIGLAEADRLTAGTRSDWLMDQQPASNEVDRLRSAVMSLWDPIGVADVPEAVDEYDSYLPAIERELRHGSITSLSGYLHEVATTRMGLSRAELEDHRSAEALFDWWTPEVR